MHQQNNNLAEFISKIDNFFGLSYSRQIDFLSYYIIYVCQQDILLSKDITNKFLELNTKPHSNVASYLLANSKKKSDKYVKVKNGYKIATTLKMEIDNLLSIKIEKKPSNLLVDLSLFEETRGYLIDIVTEANRCYDENLPTACLVMIRKIIEILIIDFYEKNNNTRTITNANGNYFYLSELITVLKNDNSIKLNRNADKSLDYFKLFGDMAAHGKFKAKISDIDNSKNNLRIVIDQLLILIDYRNIKKT